MIGLSRRLGELHIVTSILPLQYLFPAPAGIADDDGTAIIVQSTSRISSRV